MNETILRSFSNDTRLKLMVCLSQGPKNVTQLISNCGLSQSAVSQHLNKLRESGLVTKEKKGKEVFYQLTNPEAARLSRNLINFLQEVKK